MPALLAHPGASAPSSLDADVWLYNGSTASLSGDWYCLGDHWDSGAEEWKETLYRWDTFSDDVVLEAVLTDLLPDNGDDMYFPESVPVGDNATGKLYFLGGSWKGHLYAYDPETGALDIPPSPLRLRHQQGFPQRRRAPGRCPDEIQRLPLLPGRCGLQRPALLLCGHALPLLPPAG